MTKTLTAKQHYWLKHIQTAQSSDMSLAEYARHHRIKAQSLYNWAKYFRDRKFASQNVAFVELKTPQAPPLGPHFHSRAIIRLPNGIELAVPELNQNTLQWLVSL